MEANRVHVLSKGSSLSSASKLPGGESMLRVARSSGLVERSNTSIYLYGSSQFLYVLTFKKLLHMGLRVLKTSSLRDLCKHGVLSGKLGKLRGERREGGSPGPGWAL